MWRVHAGGRRRLERRFWKTPVVVDIVNIDGNVRVSLPPSRVSPVPVPDSIVTATGLPPWKLAGHEFNSSIASDVLYLADPKASPRYCLVLRLPEFGWLLLLAVDGAKCCIRIIPGTNKAIHPPPPFSHHHHPRPSVHTVQPASSPSTNIPTPSPCQHAQALATARTPPRPPRPPSETMAAGSYG